jgi:hypothetical protein
MNNALIDIPCIIGSISGDIDGKCIQGCDSLQVKWFKIGDITFVERNFL